MQVLISRYEHKTKIESLLTNWAWRPQNSQWCVHTCLRPHTHTHRAINEDLFDVSYACSQNNFNPRPLRKSPRFFVNYFKLFFWILLARTNDQFFHICLSSGNGESVSGNSCGKLWSAKPEVGVFARRYSISEILQKWNAKSIFILSILSQIVH